MSAAILIAIVLALVGAFVAYVFVKGAGAKGKDAGNPSSVDPVIRVAVIFSPNGTNRGIVGSDGDPSKPGDQAYPKWRATAEGAKGYRDVPFSVIRRIWPDASIEGGQVIVTRTAHREGGQGHPVLVVREVHFTPGIFGGGTWRFVAPSWEVSSSGNTAAVVVGTVLVAGATVAGTIVGGPAGGAAAGIVAGAIAEQIR